MAIVKTSKQESKDKQALKQIMSAPVVEKKEPVIVTSATRKGPGRPPKPQTAPVPTPAPKPQMPPNAIQITGPGATPEALSGIALKDMLRTMQALAARVQELETHLAGLASKGGKGKKGASFTPEELIEGIDVPSNDWRHDYQGAYVDLLPCARQDPKKGEIEGDFVVFDNKPPVSHFLCMPRDFDIGKEGQTARAQGRIAAHWGASEDGSYAEQPVYFSREELIAVWPSEEN
jgi:hypothetical protein